ncbi:MAG: hypothetical protein ABSE49_24730 [Polyangiaceae bacterium]|jgi:hypothetical protein
MIVRKVRTWSLVALGATVVLPIAVACQPPDANQPPNVAGAGTAGYPYPGYPPGQPGYPAAGQPGYPAPGTYPAAGQPTYPAPGGQPVYPGTVPPGGQPMPGQPLPGQPAPSGSAAPPLAPTDPNSLQGILQGIQNAMQGQTVPGGGGGGGAGGDLTDLGLKAQAMRVAPGMQPDGDELKQNLQQGQHAVMMVTLQAGKCYTLVGFSLPGAVADLDLNLLAPPLYMTLAGQDLTHNNMPVIGAHPSEMCPVIAFPLQYKLDVVANKGSGIVAVQLFSKNK